MWKISREVCIVIFTVRTNRKTKSFTSTLGRFNLGGNFLQNADIYHKFPEKFSTKDRLQSSKGSSLGRFYCTYIASTIRYITMVYIFLYTETINKINRKLYPRIHRFISIHINTTLRTFPENDRQVTGKKHIQKIICFICHLEAEILANNDMPMNPELFVHRIFYHSCSRLWI